MTRPRPDDPLVCPRCATTHSLDERFCPDCGMPLVHSGAVDGSGDLELTELQERARKIKPQLSEGPLTKVAAGRNQAEAEFIQGLLLEEGVPSMLKRSAGSDVPDLLAAGRRDVLVPRSGVDVARDVLMESELLPAPGSGATRAVDSPSRILLGLLSALVLVAIIAWIGTELLV
jgi:pimeloyl-ACP methyl ester carboxylesterase